MTTKTVPRRYFLRMLGTFVFGATLISGAVHGAEGVPIKHGAHPNIVVIMADDMGFSDLGCYGGEIETPNLDNLAANGLRFTQIHNAGVCWPSRACIFTGYYSRQIDAENRVKGAAYSSWTTGIPQYLSKAGYQSYHSGKWHLNRSPIELGFAKDKEPGSWRTDTRSSEQIIGQGIRYIEEHVRTHPDAAFYVAADLIAPHFPLHALPEDIEKLRARYTVGWDAIRVERARRAKELGIVKDPTFPLELGGSLRW